MMQRLTRSHVILLLLLSTSLIGSAQTAVRPTVEERNVRAQMQFLASDAMQGRGSGTVFERIAAEYIGSQFMQFGLEPAGESGWDGKPSYVQTVKVTGRPRLKGLKFGRAEGSMFTLGKEWVPMSIANAEIKGALRKIDPSGSVAPGEIALVILKDENTLNAIQPRIDQWIKDGAAAILLSETEELRRRWIELTDRRPSLSRRGNVIVLRQAAANFLSSLAENPASEPIDIIAEFAEPEISNTWNAVGKLTGADPTLSAEVILLSSHLDHVGVRPTTPGEDKIFNGADDDASGTVAVLEIARILAAGKRPQRTIYFASFGSEEAGGHGSNHFVNNLPFPKEKLIANLQFEMIGRPDSKVKPDELWLTGFERSTLGPEMAKRGARIVQDPHPEQNFFQRSDN